MKGALAFCRLSRTDSQKAAKNLNRRKQRGEAATTRHADLQKEAKGRI
jgi:hypothetical protein